jgi:transcriptional regulator with PAS, ATPase and Fis domain
MDISLPHFIAKAASTNSTLLLTGESGTGKTSLVQHIHSLSSRSNRPLVSISCAALPRDLLEAELFGYERGAFTGAHATKLGLVEQADGGTLFLDEIGDLPLELQPKLLTFLQSREVLRLGSTTPKSIDIRVVTATWQNLTELCSQKKFREDLFYRLKVLSFELPPFRVFSELEKKKIIDNCLLKVSNTTKQPTPTITSAAYQQLFTYDFPGNIRELENILENATIFASNQKIEPHNLIFRSRPLVNNKAPQPEQPSTAPETLNLQELEKQAVLRALTATHWNRTTAARLLGISEKGLYNKIRRFELEKR